MARSRRACPERSRGNPGDACWQMLFPAFQPQTTNQINKGPPGSERKSEEPEALSICALCLIRDCLKLLVRHRKVEGKIAAPQSPERRIHNLSSAA